MADSTRIPADALQAIALQIGERLFSAQSSAADAVPAASAEGGNDPDGFESFAGVSDFAGGGFELAETFEVWKLAAGAVEEFGQTGEDLARLARPTRAYHHQIKAADGAGKRAVAFAHSWLMGPGQWSVRDIFFAPLAAAVDEAVSVADELIEEEVVARLLSLPEYKIDALWFVNTQPARPARGRRAQGVASRVIVVAAPRSFAGPTMSLLSSSDFMRALGGARRGSGFIV